MVTDTGGDGGVDYGGKCVRGGLLDASDAAEVFEEALAGAGAYTGDGVELAVAVAHLAAFAVVGDGKAVGFITDLLHEVEDGGAAVEDYGVVLLALDVDDLFLLRDGGEGLEGDAQFGQGVCCGVELAEAAIDQDEGRERLLVVLQALVAAMDDLTHAGEVVYTADGFDLEFAVVGLLHGAVFPDDHGGYGFGTLDVGDVEALDAAGEFFEGEGFLQGFLDRVDAGLEDAEALVVGLAGVLADKIDEGSLVAALGGGEFDAVAGALGEEVGEECAIGEVDGDKDGARDVGLVEVELFEQGGEEGRWTEG